MNKKGQYRFNLGSLDLVSAIIFIIGISIVNKNEALGWILMIMGLLKQWSGK